MIHQVPLVHRAPVRDDDAAGPRGLLPRVLGAGGLGLEPARLLAVRGRGILLTLQVLYHAVQYSTGYITAGHTSSSYPRYRGPATPSRYAVKCENNGKYQ